MGNTDRKKGSGRCRAYPAVLYLLFLAVVFPSCQRQTVLNSVLMESTSAVEQNDSEIFRITHEARAGLPIFFRHMARPENGESDFSIKYPFKTDPGSGIGTEQIWLTGIRFRNGKYYGTLANSPMYIRRMKKGDTVEFLVDEITDWMYIREGKITGGLSIKYLLEQIPENRRSDGQKKLLQMF